jgi:hypothetical protein
MNRAIWLDKLAMKQYQGSQKTWPAIANLQYLCRPVIVYFPEYKQPWYYNKAMQWHKDKYVEQETSDLFDCIQSCNKCNALIKSSHCNRNSVISLGLANRCWPTTERSLGAAGSGSYCTNSQFEKLIQTICILEIWLKTMMTKDELQDKNMLHIMSQMEYELAAECKCFKRKYENKMLLIYSIGGLYREGITTLGHILPASSLIEDGYVGSHLESCFFKIRQNVCPHNSEEKHAKNWSELASTRLRIFQDEINPAAGLAESLSNLLTGGAAHADCFDEGDKPMAVVVLSNLKQSLKLVEKWDMKGHPFADLLHTFSAQYTYVRPMHSSYVVWHNHRGEITGKELWAGTLSGHYASTAVHKMMNFLCLQNTVDIFVNLQKSFFSYANIVGHAYILRPEQGTHTFKCKSCQPSYYINKNFTVVGILYKLFDNVCKMAGIGSNWSDIHLVLICDFKYVIGFCSNKAETLKRVMLKCCNCGKERIPARFSNEGGFSGYVSLKEVNNTKANEKTKLLILPLKIKHTYK